MLDIEKLHRDTIQYDNGELHGSGVGKTTVIVEKVVGSALTANPESVFIVLCHSSSWLMSIWRLILSSFEKNVVSRASEGDILLRNGTHIMFCTPDTLFCCITGIYITNYFIDDEDTLIAQQSIETITEIMHMLKIHSIRGY